LSWRSSSRLRRWRSSWRPVLGRRLEVSHLDDINFGNHIEIILGLAYFFLKRFKEKRRASKRPASPALLSERVYA
jgi:hypothetical protein